MEIGWKPRGTLTAFQPACVQHTRTTSHTRRQWFVLRETMSGLEARLDPARFLRIHRSRIVRVDAIETIEPQASGQFVFRLHSGIRLGSGRIHRDRIRARLDLA